MRTFRRRRPRPSDEACPRGGETGRAIDDDLRVATLRDDADPELRAAARAETEATLRAIAAEALILQDAAEELLLEIRDRHPLAAVARRGGRLASRFLALREALPRPDDPDLERCACALGEVLTHHAHIVSSSLDLLAFGWRSPRIIERIERLDGLGEPALRLEGIWRELRRDDGADC